MKNPIDEIKKHPVFDHTFKLLVLYDRTEDSVWPIATCLESQEEILRYRDEGLGNISSRRIDYMAQMTRSGYCAHPSGLTPQEASHTKCKLSTCTCPCHKEEKVWSGQGILFAIVDDRERMPPGRSSTVSVIASAIEDALDAGYDTSDGIARFLTTSAFQHVQDRRVRFNSVLKASDVVGAQIVKKLYNAYDELMDMAESDPDLSDEDKQAVLSEAKGFAEAIQIVMSPFSSEDPNDPQLVDWSEVDHLTSLFEKEQAKIRLSRENYND